MLNYYFVSTYRAYKKHWDLRAQIDWLRATATEEKLSERTDSEISDEVDQGLISLVDKSTYRNLLTVEKLDYKCRHLKKSNEGSNFPLCGERKCVVAKSGHS